MRTPIGLIICLLAAAAGTNATIAPAAAGLRVRAPLARGVTLGVYPSPAVAGEPALVAGRVNGPGAPNATVTLWQRPPGTARTTALAQVSADATGAFVFTRADAPIDQTETLYATAAGLRSRSVHESVAATVTLAAPSAIVPSGTAVALSGRVTPAAHAGESVFVQQRLPAGWQTVTRATVSADGSFSASPAFTGTHAVSVRALFPGDAHNLPGVSDPVDLLVQATPGARLSLLASSDPLTVGQTVTLSGTLAGTGPGSGGGGGTGAAGSGTAPTTAGVPVTLLAGPDAADEQPVASTVTDGDGNYSFSQTPTATTVFAVRTPALTSGPLVVGVQSTVSLAASTLTAPLGATQSIQGTVAGAGPGSDVALQLLGGDGVYHTIAAGHLSSTAGAGAGFSFVTTLTDPGSETYRVLCGGDASHQSGFSLPLTVLVTPRAALQVAAALGQA